MPTTKSREDKVRRQLAKLEAHGWYYRLHKTPSRHWTRSEYGPGYMISHSNVIQIGCRNRVYESTIDMIEWFTDELIKKHL